MKQQQLVFLLLTMLSSLFTINTSIAQCVADTEIKFANGEVSLELCSSQERIKLVPGSNAGQYAFAITNGQGEIEDVQLGNILNLRSLTTGGKRIYGISWFGVLHQPVGQQIDDAIFSDYCFELSTNFLQLSIAGGHLGSLSAANMSPCLQDGSANLMASATNQSVDDGYEILYVLTKGTDLVIQAVNASPEFEVTEAGIYTIHSLIYNPITLDLTIVEPGVTTGFDVNGLLAQGGGSICALLDVSGAKFYVNEPIAGTLSTTNSQLCLEEGGVALMASISEEPNVPEGFSLLHVLTSGLELTIEQVGAAPEFTVETSGIFTIHTLIYDPSTLDLGIVELGVTTGVDINGFLVQGGGSICASLDVTGARFDVISPSAGTLIPDADVTACSTTEMISISASVGEEPEVPEGYSILYVLTSGESLVIEAVGEDPQFEVTGDGVYTIHTLVYNPASLDLSIVVPGVTTGFDVNGLLNQGGGSICASLDVTGAAFHLMKPNAGNLQAQNPEACAFGGENTRLVADIVTDAMIPAGYQKLYVLTSGSGLVIENVSDEPEFEVSESGVYTIHTLVYDPTTLDLGIVQIGVTTGVDVNGLLVQGGGAICASLDVSGAQFTVTNPDAGTLTGGQSISCSDETPTVIEASTDGQPVIPDGFEVIYVLTSGNNLIIEGVNGTPMFSVESAGLFTIHTLVYDPATLDLGIVQIGMTTGFDVNRLLAQGGGSICASLDVAGTKFMVGPDAGSLTPASEACIDQGEAMLIAGVNDDAIIPEGFSQLFVLTQGEGLIITGVNDLPEFSVSGAGLFTIHSLVYDPATLDLGVVEVGVTSGFDVNGLLQQGGGSICASLDVPGAAFMVSNPNAGTLTATSSFVCFDGDEVQISAMPNGNALVPDGYSQLFVLTSDDDLVIEQVATEPQFTVMTAGKYTIHTLVYDANTLDLSIVEPGVTTGVDINTLIVQGGGDICASLDVAGAVVMVGPYAGTLMADEEMPTIAGGMASLSASIENMPYIPSGYDLIYVLTSGDDLVIQNVAGTPDFSVQASGKYTIHSLVYDPMTLDLGIVQIGVTTGVDVNGLLVQGGGEICAALNVAGAAFEVVSGMADVMNQVSILEVNKIIMGGLNIQMEINSTISKESMMQVFDLTGRVIDQRQILLHKGFNKIEIELDEKNPASMYFIRIDHLTSKIVKSW